MRAKTAIGVLVAMSLLSTGLRGADPPDEFYKVLPSKTKSGGKPLPRGRVRRPDDEANVDPKDAETHTSISVELLVGDEGVGLKAQQWQQAFQKLGCSVRIRSGLPTDKIETREQRVSRIRQVSVVGSLERSGRLVFQGRAFNADEIAALGEWINELKTYGAQGSPEGKPLWGLDKNQFERLFKELSAVVTAETAGLALDKATGQLAASTNYPLVQKTSARERLAGITPTSPVAQELKGFSKGTALAVVLAEYGLGYRPQRTPEGSIELAVESLDKTSDTWPAGWDLPAGSRPPDVFPKFYQVVSIDITERPLPEALKAIADQTDVPILRDAARIRHKGIKIDDIRVKQPLKKSSFELVLRRLTTPHHLIHHLHVDENGRPFVWITTLEPAKLTR